MSSVTAALARAVLDHPAVRIEGAWPRAAAFLARQALEEALDRYWQRSVDLRSATRRAQLACLPIYLKDDELVMGVRTAWATLSRATHHHIYELSPTAPELDVWLTTVESLAAALDETT